MNVWRILMSLALAVSALMVSGCASLPAEQVESAQQGILDHLSAVQQWPPEQLDTQLPVLESAYVQDPVTENRLRLAVTLAFGDCDKCDSVRALKLFKEEVEAGNYNASTAFASLCVDLLEAKANTVKASKDLAKERQKVKELQQKLDALTSIEKSLHLRE